MFDIYLLFALNPEEIFFNKWFKYSTITVDSLF